jgi:hypothetical protein
MAPAVDSEVIRPGWRRFGCIFRLLGAIGRLTLFLRHGHHFRIGIGRFRLSVLAVPFRHLFSDHKVVGSRGRIGSGTIDRCFGARERICRLLSLCASRCFSVFAGAHDLLIRLLDDRRGLLLGNDINRSCSCIGSAAVDFALGIGDRCATRCFGGRSIMPLRLGIGVRLLRQGALGRRAVVGSSCNGRRLFSLSFRRRIDRSRRRVSCAPVDRRVNLGNGITRRRLGDRGIRLLAQRFRRSRILVVGARLSAVEP